MRGSSILIVALAFIACSSNSGPAECVPPCSPGYVCDDGTCIEPCNPACGPGYFCDVGSATCVPVDAGTDTTVDWLDSSSDSVIDPDALEETEPPADAPADDITIECSPFELECDGICIDPMTDRLNCGTCDHICPMEALCVWGECECQPAGTDYCEGDCIPVEEDRENCGECGNECGELEVCSEGDCVACHPLYQTVCSNECIWTSFDRFNCGGCGNVCPTPQFCYDGSCEDCTGTYYAMCDGYCTILSVDHFNCGYCGNECPFSSPFCNAGSCH